MQRCGQPQPCLVAARFIEEARRVVAVQQIVHPQICFIGVQGQRPVEAAAEFRRGKRVLRQPRDRCVAEEIIHRAVEPVRAYEPPGVAPCFAKQDAVRLTRAHRRGEGFQKRGRQLIRHIQPPAVDAEFLQPVPANGEEIVPRVRVCKVQLRHPFVMPDAVVILPLCIDGIAMDKEPAAIRRRFAVFDNVLKFVPPVAAVVEHAVEDDAHSACVDTVDQPPQIVLRAEGRVDLEIIGRVVLVVRRRAEDGRQIQARHAERLNIVELLRNARQIAAHEILPRRRRAPIFRTRRGEGGISVLEPLREDLIVHLPAPPRGRGKAVRRVRPEEFEEIPVHVWLRILQAVRAEPQLVRPGFQVEAVPGVRRDLAGADRRAVVIVQRVL